MSKMIKNELKFILPFALIADAVVYVCSFIFIGINYRVALGLVLGTLIMIVNLVMLGNASEASLRRFILDGSVIRAKRKMFASYILRSLILALALYVSLVFDAVNTVGVLIPLLYVKPAYMIKSLISGKKEDA